MNAFRVFRVHAVALLILAPLLLGACVKMPKKPYPKRRFFALDATREGAPGPKATAGRAEVGAVRISPRFAGSEMVYRTGELEYRSDYYNAFFRSPATHITEELREWMAASGAFSGVRQAGSAATIQYTIEPVVNSLYADFREKDKSQAVLEMQFYVASYSSGANRTLLDTRYTEALPVDSRQAETLATAWSAALGKILTAFEADLRKALSAESKP